MTFYALKDFRILNTRKMSGPFRVRGLSGYSAVNVGCLVPSAYRVGQRWSNILSNGGSERGENTPQRHAAPRRGRRELPLAGHNIRGPTCPGS